LHIYVINLARQKDRRDSVSRQLEGLGVEYSFFRAIEAPGALKNHFMGRNNWPCQMEVNRVGAPTEVACYASHLSLWKKCVELDESIVVLEDDFELTPEFTAAIELSRNLIDDYGFIRLEPIEKQWTLYPFEEPILARKTKQFKLLFQVTVSLRTTAYAISPEYALRFIEISNKFSVPVDHFFRRPWVHKLPLFALEPPAIGLSILADTPSIVREEKPRKTKKKKSPMRHFIKRCRKMYVRFAKRATQRINKDMRKEYRHLFD
jgi:glycosyl transferase family 25